MSRDYPALELRWRILPGADHLEQLLAAIDDDAPTAVEERPDGLRVFFATPATRARAAERLRAADPAVTCAAIDVPDEDWAARSQASLGPVQVGGIVVTPPEKDLGGRKKTSEVITVIIAPSMGFGTGHHASTRLCLALLQRVPVAGARVLDVGTGSGVLAIAAWMLGARDVVAADYDADALTAARENLERNNAAGIHVALVDLAGIRGTDDVRLQAPFDLLLANLTGGVLIRHAGTLAGLLAAGGRIVASGFQADEVPAVSGAFAGAGLAPIERRDEDGWIGAVFSRATIPISSTAR